MRDPPWTLLVANGHSWKGSSALFPDNRNWTKEGHICCMLRHECVVKEFQQVAYRIFGTSCEVSYTVMELLGIPFGTT